MKQKHARIAKAKQQLQEQLLLDLVDPLARARLKDALNVPLCEWSNAELHALRATFTAESTVEEQHEPIALPDLSALTLDELQVLKLKLERGVR